MATIKSGWTDAGNGLVKNTSTGQMLPQDHPDYLNAPDDPNAPRQATVSDTSLAGGQPSSAPASSSSAPPQGDTPPAGSTDPFASSGGGVYFSATGQWVPKNNPTAISAAQGAASGSGASGTPTTSSGYGTTGSQNGSSGSSAPPATSSDPLTDAATAGQTYSATPTAAPTDATSNQATQDVYRNKLLQMATQDTTVNPETDPNMRAAVDSYSAGQERARRQALDSSAESLAANGMGSSGSLDQARAQGIEKSAQDTSSFESNLALQEMQQKRSEIANALNSLGTTISGDQSRALQQKLADLDATIKKMSIAQTGTLGQEDIALRSKLGIGGLNLDAIKTMLQNQQFNNQLGVNVGMDQATLNAQALRTALGI